MLDLGLLTAVLASGLTGLGGLGPAAVVWPYRFAMHAWRGQTVGKIVLGLRVVGEGSQLRPSLGAIAAREALYALFVLPSLIPAWIATLLDLEGRQLAYAVVPMILFLPAMPLGLGAAVAMMRFTRERTTWADLAAKTQVVNTRSANVDQGSAVRGAM